MTFPIPERAQEQLALDPEPEVVETAPLVCPSCRRPFPTLAEIGPSVHNEARETEKLAALRQEPKLGTARARVLGALLEAGVVGLTDEQIAEQLEMRLYTAAPRRNELVRGGWVVDSNRQRATSTGSPATVWTISPWARERLER